MNWCSVSSSAGGLFDIPTKLAQRGRLNDLMAQPNFWDNPEKAQQTINQLKPLNGLLNPFAALESSVGDLQALAELCDEDPALEEEMARELGSFEHNFEDFELRAMFSGPQDASNAYVRIQAGAGGT